MKSKSLPLLLLALSSKPPESASTEIASYQENLRKYYSCYFNKYFGISDGQHQADRNRFVQGILETKRQEKETAPSDSCVEWICSANLKWKRLHRNDLPLMGPFFHGC